MCAGAVFLNTFDILVAVVAKVVCLSACALRGVQMLLLGPVPSCMLRHCKVASYSLGASVAWQV